MIDLKVQLILLAKIKTYLQYKDLLLKENPKATN